MLSRIACARQRPPSVRIPLQSAIACYLPPTRPRRPQPRDVPRELREMPYDGRPGLCGTLAPLLSQVRVSSGLVAPYGFFPRFFLTLARFLPALLVAPADEVLNLFVCPAAWRCSETPIQTRS